MMESRLLVNAALAVLITVGATAQGQPASCPPTAFSPQAGPDLVALASWPWFVQQQLPVAPPATLFCVRTSFVPLLPSNISRGFLVSTSAANGGPNGTFTAIDLFGVRSNNPTITAQNGPDAVEKWSQDVSEQATQALLDRSLAGSVSPDDVVILPVNGSRMLVATAQQLVTTNDGGALPPVWVLAVGPAPAGTVVNQAPAIPSTSPTIYDWIILASGKAPSVPTSCGCGYTSTASAASTATPATPAPAPVPTPAPVPPPATTAPPVPPQNIPVTVVTAPSPAAVPPAAAPPPSPAPPAVPATPPTATPGTRVIPVQANPPVPSGTPPKNPQNPDNPTQLSPPEVVAVYAIASRADGIVFQAQCRIRDVMDNIRQRAQQIRDSIQDSIQDTQNSIRNRIQDSQDSIADRIQDVANSIRDTINNVFRGRRMLQVTPPPPAAAATPPAVPPAPTPSPASSVTAAASPAASAGAPAPSASATATTPAGTITASAPPPAAAQTPPAPSPAAPQVPPTPSPAAAQIPGQLPGAGASGSTSASACSNPPAGGGGCGCDVACATSRPQTSSNAAVDGGLWLLTRKPDDPQSVAAMRSALQALGVDISGLVPVCQAGCWSRPPPPSRSQLTTVTGQNPPTAAEKGPSP